MGHVEPNETEIETALRELEEETGISQVKLVDNFRYPIKYTFFRKSKPISKEVIFYYYLKEFRSNENQADD